MAYSRQRRYLLLLTGGGPPPQVPTFGYEELQPQRPAPSRVVSAAVLCAVMPAVFAPTLTQAQATQPPVKIPEPCLPSSSTRPAWNPERSWLSSVPYQPPRPGAAAPVLPERPARLPWNPERSEQRTPLLPPVVAAPTWGYEFQGPHRFPAPWRPERTLCEGHEYQPPQPGAGPVLPTSATRPAWVPERSGVFLPATTPAAVVTPTVGNVVAPERWARPAWNPERSWIVQPPGPASQLVVPPVGPRFVCLPDRLVLPWQPERTETFRPIVVVQVQAVAPCLPERWARPARELDRSATVTPVVVAPREGRFAGPERIVRPPWNPERSAVVQPSGPDSQLVIPPRTAAAFWGPTVPPPRPRPPLAWVEHALQPPTWPNIEAAPKVLARVTRPVLLASVTQPLVTCSVYRPPVLEAELVQPTISVGVVRPVLSITCPGDPTP